MGRVSRRLLRKQRPPKTTATQMRHQAKAQKFKRRTLSQNEEPFRSEILQTY